MKGCVAGRGNKWKIQEALICPKHKANNRNQTNER